jgi:hypothetical protein
MTGPRRTAFVRVATPLFLIFGFASLAMIYGNYPPGLAQAPPLPRTVSIQLLGPAEAINGMEVPRGLANKGSTYLRIQERAKVSVRLPGDRTIRQEVNYVSVHIDHGVVVDVTLLPLVKSVPFRDAVAELRRLMQLMDIKPDERMRAEIASWPDESGHFISRTRTELDEASVFEVYVRPVDTDGTFYLALTFAASVKAGAIAEAAAKLITVPASPPAAGSRGRPKRVELEAKTGKRIPEVSLALLDSVRRVSGIWMHEALPKASMYTPEILQPHRLGVFLPGGRSLNQTVSGMAFLSSHGVVEGIYARHPSRPAPYPEALADLRRTIKELGLKPDGAMRAQMAHWPAEEPPTGPDTNRYDIRAAMPLSEAVRLELRILPDPKGGWYYLIMFDGTPEACGAAQTMERLATLPGDGTQFSRRPGHASESNPGAGRPDVLISLLGPTEKARGLDMGERVPERSLAWPELLRPCRLTVRLPDGRTMALDARGVALLSDHGIVFDVFARRPLEPVSFHEAVADLLQALKDMGIAPDAAMREPMTRWPADQPWAITASGLHDFEAAMSLCKDVRLEGHVRPDPRGGWYTLLIFSATTEARTGIRLKRRAAQNSDSEPKSKRPTPEAKSEEADRGSNR